MNIKFIGTIIALIIGGMIGLQSTVTSTARAETEIVHIRDTVTNYQVIVDKRVVTEIETDTLVRVVNKTTYEKDCLWAAKALNMKQPEMAKPTFVSHSNLDVNIPSIGVPIE